MHEPMPSVTAQEPVIEDDLDTALRRARVGDEAGFLTLWRTLQPRLLRFLRVYGVQSAVGGCEDVAADTWLQVVRDLGTFSGDADDFRGWLFTIARNRAIDAGRSRARRPVVLVGDARDLPSQATSRSAEEQVMERLATDEAVARVRQLPPAQAELVALRVLADLDVSTVAAIVGSTPGAVRVGVHRALKTLSAQARPTALESM